MHLSFLLAVSLTLGRNFSVLFLLLVLASSQNAHAARGERFMARYGVVATDETECSKIGKDILRRGRHAVDAAVAATLCLGVVSPSFSGLVGGKFMLVKSSSGKAKVLDMREMTPGDHPSAKSAIMADKELRTIFAPNGELLLQGKTVRLRKLADTLVAIAKQGMKTFYDGSMAQSLADDIRKAGVIITKEDFQKYRVVLRDPLVVYVFGYEIVTVPPPASGGAMIILVSDICGPFRSYVKI
ncbi:hypothetical protein DH2020_043255 [Rehmannia glutinosa]|uniref:Gamma-glutamyltranspeptidase n=1 Tax=Rehmannia glutinosa TaxID=99300 RepID=A0ABR0UK56_REHGL